MSLRGFALASWLFATALGCGSEPPRCVDDDGDGFGEHCEAGKDCDDADAERALRCNGEPEPDCDEDTYAEGCPCARGALRACYPAPAHTQDVGGCHEGQQVCRSEGWKACEGAVLPELELCNGEDDDCDGIADEGVISPCGGCNTDCIGAVWGSDSAPFEAGNGLEISARGELVLAYEQVTSETVWVPNTAEATVSKIDGRTAVEVARYATGGEAPERVAVDYRGDAWVLERALDGQSALIKIAADPSRCVDGAGDGLDTSSGGDDVRAFGADDCVLLRVPVGEPGEVASSLAVDGTLGPDGLLGGRVWVGLEHGQRVIEVDGEQGGELRSVAFDDFRPYAAQFDPWGEQWLIDRRGKLARVGTASDAAVEIIDVLAACYELEALSIERDGTLLLSGFSCEQLSRYDPVSGRFRIVPTEDLRTPRGVSVDLDQGWVAYTSGELGRVGRTPFALLEVLPLASVDAEPFESIAVSADSLGQVWVVSTLGASDGVHGVATRVEAESGEVTAQVPVGLGPRGQGDLTGTQRLGWYVPSGTSVRRFDGCGFETGDLDPELQGRATDWQSLHLAWVGAEGAAVKAEARHATDASGLEAAAWRELGALPEDEPPYALDFPDGGVVEVRLTLTTAGALGSPRVAYVGVEWRCPGPD